MRPECGLPGWRGIAVLADRADALVEAGKIELDNPIQSYLQYHIDSLM